MEEHDIFDYIPVIGDIYKYGKVGYKVCTWISDNEADYNNQILSNMIDAINKASSSGDAVDALKYISESIAIINDFDTNHTKKYQVALLYYLGARVFHILALCHCIIYNDDLKELKQVSSIFDEAKRFCTRVWDVEKTLLTSNRAMIDQIRTMSNEKAGEIIASKRNWKKQYRCLYRRVHPFKWYLGMWMFA